MAEAAPGAATEDPQTAAWAARQLGVHYLKRYFLLISYRSFLDQADAASGGTAPTSGGVAGGTAGGSAGGAAGAAASGGGAAPFVRWMEERRELGHLLAHLSLET